MVSEDWTMSRVPVCRVQLDLQGALKHRGLPTSIGYLSPTFSCEKNVRRPGSNRMSEQCETKQIAMFLP